MDFNRCYGCMKPKTGGPVCEYCGYQDGSANAMHQLPVGTVLKEQYLVGRVLGQGGFGITYLGWDLYLDIPVAIKEYYPNGMVMRESTISLDVVSCGGDDGLRFRNNKERFLREAKMLARFSQVTEIVQIRNFFLTNNTAYIVMEYVEGKTLKQYVKDRGGRLSVEETLSILGPVMEALSKVHKAGVVHRDISPDNVMMLPDGSAKLLDFGAVRDVGAAAVDKELTKSTEAILKQGYAPIEQYQKRGSLGPWTDVYALCATIYFCLTGEPPADAPERLLMDEALYLEEKVPELKMLQRQALEHGLTLRTEQRTGSMELLYEELFREEKEPVPAVEAVPVPAPAEAVQKPEKLAEPEKAEPAQKQKPKQSSREKKRKPEKAPVPEKEAKQEAASVREKEPPAQRKKRRKGHPFRWPAVILLAVAVMILVFSQSAEKEIPIPFVDNRISGTCGDSATWTLDPDTGDLIVKGSGTMAAYRPEWKEAQDRQPAPWWDYREQITAVTVTGEVCSVGQYSFAGLENLKTVTIDAPVSEIHTGAFQLSGLENVQFLPVPAEDTEDQTHNLTFIGADAFRGTALTEVALPESVVSIENGAFADCAGLESVILGEYTVPSFDMSGTGVFENCAEDLTIHCYLNTAASEYTSLMGLNRKVIKARNWDLVGQCGKALYYYVDEDTGILSIKGSGALWDYKNEADTGWSNRKTAPWLKHKDQIRTLILGADVTEVGENAFAGLVHLETICWPESMKVIARQSFENTGMKTVKLPANITEIEEYAFSRCSKLTEIHLPENLKTLREDAIADCPALKAVWIGQSTTVGDWSGSPFTADKMVYKLTIYGLQGSDAGRFAEKYGYDFAIGARGMAAEYEGQCGDKAWWFLSADTLVLYGTGATWMYNLSEEDISGWAKWEYNAGRAYRGHPKFWEKQAQIRHIQVLPGLSELRNGLFADLYQVKTVDLGTITKCYAHFWGANRLKEVVFPETVREVGGWALNGCSGLNTVIFEGSPVIDEMVFNGCYSLREVIFNGGREQIRGELFSTDNNLGQTMQQKVIFRVKRHSGAETYAKNHALNYKYIN